MRKRLGPTMYIQAQAMYQMDTFEAMYNGFKRDYPHLFKPNRIEDSICVRKFEDLAPWNLKAGKQETCLCKACENFGMYETALSEVLDLLDRELLDGAADSVDEVTAD
jgi:hypothetical protein